LKRIVPHQAGVPSDAERIEVGPSVAALVQKGLWRDVGGASGQNSFFLKRSQTEVDQLGERDSFVGLSDQNILRFDIKMINALAMEITQSAEGLYEELFDFLIGEGTSGIEDVMPLDVLGGEVVKLFLSFIAEIEDSENMGVVELFEGGKFLLEIIEDLVRGEAGVIGAHVELLERRFHALLFHQKYRSPEPFSQYLEDLIFVIDDFQALSPFHSY
jgi:hypothetical protein